MIYFCFSLFKNLQIINILDLFVLMKVCYSNQLIACLIEIDLPIPVNP